MRRVDYGSIKGLAPDPVDPKAREIATPIVEDIKVRGNVRHRNQLAPHHHRPFFFHFHSSPWAVKLAGEEALLEWAVKLGDVKKGDTHRPHTYTRHVPFLLSVPPFCNSMCRALSNATIQLGLGLGLGFLSLTPRSVSGEPHIIDKEGLKAAFDALDEESKGVLTRTAKRIETFALAQRASVQAPPMRECP